ncbi:NHL repeat-containing protein [Candidatus Acetothermia bacterium]|nr:NHL repeat-containing protein [Candidatus Acetothermia bacterium]MBI3459675.1 NHL repeat-containing protein [Candidatus Acetothermia bacterium]
MVLSRKTIIGISLSFLVLAVGIFFWLEKPFNGQSSSRTITGFRTPESVAVGPDGKYYVSNIGAQNTPGDGSIKQIAFDGENAIVTDFATGLNDPKGAAFFGKELYVADVNQVWKIDPSGNKSVFLTPENFPVMPVFLNDTAFDAAGNLYVSDTFKSVVFRATPQSEVSVALDKSKLPELGGPNGLLVDSENNLYVVDLNTGKVWKVTPSGEATVILPNVGAGDGIAFDSQKNIYVSDFLGGRVLKRDTKGEISIFASGFTSPADITIDTARGLLVVPEFDANRVTLVPLAK